VKSFKNIEYKTVPGRGLGTMSAINIRQDYLRKIGFEIDKISRCNLEYADINNNIESVIGSIEIPVGIVGPLLFNDKENFENVYTIAGTLEGALVASMNRGAKAISLSNGFSAHVYHQKMVRAPLFILKTTEQANLFTAWIAQNFDQIKEVAQSYSNHAILIEILPYSSDNDVHLRFVYTTGDAAGQNMTTTCTWHAMLWIVENFKLDTDIEIKDFVIEGNGSSDKKASHFMIDHGRGVSVEAECTLSDDVIHKVLRTSSDQILKFYQPSCKIAKNDGMLGFNINVANAIAAIFVATGQDLGSIPESSVANLILKKHKTGLTLKLKLHSLVIGTVGGGVSQAKQNEALKIMDCAGKDKLERFAKLIAGFALALEISTYSAIVSGEFAKAHEKIGRNKPVDWLTKADLTEDFVKKCLDGKLNSKKIESIKINLTNNQDNGILTNITQRVTKKLIGFIPLKIETKDSQINHVLIKSKSLDTDTIKGLHLMAASVDPKLSDLLFEYKNKLEYHNLHKKEMQVYNLLESNNWDIIPKFHGKYTNQSRESYLIFQEFFDKSQMRLLDSENHPEDWSDKLIKQTITTINQLHSFFSTKLNDELKDIQQFKPWESKPLYIKMAEIVNSETDNPDFQKMFSYVYELENAFENLKTPISLIHNDFNPRNVAIRNDGRACIYDWELTIKNIPHRDILEFLCFVMPENFDSQRLTLFIDFYYNLLIANNPDYKYSEHIKACLYAIKEFMVCRAAFYKVSEILMKLKFGDRIMVNSMRMIEILEEKNN